MHVASCGVTRCSGVPMEEETQTIGHVCHCPCKQGVFFVHTYFQIVLNMQFSCHKKSGALADNALYLFIAYI